MANIRTRLGRGVLVAALLPWLWADASGAWWNSRRPARETPTATVPAGRYDQMPAQPARKQRHALPPQEQAPPPRKPAPPAAPETPAPFVAMTPGPASDSGFTTVTFDFSESIKEVARWGDLSTSEILAGNGLTYKRLRAGQVLKIPAIENAIPEEVAADEMSREIWRGVRGAKRVALTFDAGGENDAAEELVAVLKETETAATFFATGRFARRFPDEMALLATAGPVYNHSDTHPDFTTLASVDVVGELRRADDSVSSQTGHSTKPYFRPPFGERNRAVLKAAADAGWKSVYWTVDSLDGYDETLKGEQLARNVLEPRRTNGASPDEFLDGAIVLMHVGNPETVKALPQIITQLRQRGFEMVTLDRLLQP